MFRLVQIESIYIYAKKKKKNASEKLKLEKLQVTSIWNHCEWKEEQKKKILDFRERNLL